MCVILHRKVLQRRRESDQSSLSPTIFSVVDGMVFRIHGHDLFYISAKSI